MKKIIALILLLLLVCASLLSCKPETPPVEPGKNGKENEKMDISALDLSEYVTLGDYKTMKVSYDSESVSKGDAAWQKLIEMSDIKKYPDDQVAFYFYQKQAGYQYMAKAGGQTYEELLASLGVTEEIMLEESKKLTAEDLIFYALVKAEGIELTQADKDANFDKYVALFVSEGYTEVYVREKLREQIYETMLYDKTLELLISFTEFTEIGGEE